MKKEIKNYNYSIFNLIDDCVSEILMKHFLEEGDAIKCKMNEETYRQFNLFCNHFYSLPSTNEISIYKNNLANVEIIIDNRIKDNYINIDLYKAIKYDKFKTNTMILK